MSHVKMKRTASRPVSVESRDRELDKAEEMDKVPVRITLKPDSPGVGSHSTPSRPLHLGQVELSGRSIALAWILRAWFSY